MRRLEGERREPFSQPSDAGLRIVRIGVIVGGHDLIPDRNRALVVHIIRNVIEMEEPVYEIAAHPQLMVRR